MGSSSNNGSVKRKPSN